MERSKRFRHNALRSARQLGWRSALLVGSVISPLLAGAQSASEVPIVPSRATQIPLSGQTSSSGQVTVMEQSTNAGAGSTVITTDSSVTVPAPYSGSVPSGTAGGVLALTLGEALGRGLRANLGALTLSASVQQAQGERRVARSELLPQVNTVVSEAFEKINLRTLGVEEASLPVSSKFNYYDARAARLTQSVFDLVRLRNLQGANETLQANLKAARNARDLIVLAVGGSYLQLLATGARMQAAQSQIVSFQAIYQQAADRLTAGLATRVDVTRSQVQLQTEQQRLRSLQADLATQKLRLARIIGLPLGQQFTPSEIYRFERVTNPSQDDALRRAQAERSDLQAADASVRAATDVVRAAKAERAPSLSVNADFGATGITPTNKSVGVYTVTGTLTVPIYQGGRVRGDIEQATAALRQRTAERDDLRAQADQDVRQAFIDLDSAADQVDVAKSNVSLSHQTLEQSRDRFTSGIADTVELVQAEQAVVQADDDYITAVYEHNLAKVSLARSMGSAEQTLPSLLTK